MLSGNKPLALSGTKGKHLRRATFDRVVAEDASLRSA